ncbi:MAG: hypothetical protein OXD44_12130 [Gammaproteobacteria bacterium]|nr:hypothetical protein [Gammaproteobacteria bacterium]MCY4228446.1 hypothetical protein [Gammaproteobacteria bacterium]MCY4314411.1 hypothetical protein [Gammaproteobacteria bacterium]
MKTRLRIRAAEHHRSMEEEVCTILRNAVGNDQARLQDLAKFTRECFDPLAAWSLKFPLAA